MPKNLSICVFCGSKVGRNPAFARAAEELGREIAVRGHRLVYGAGRIGLMGIVSDAAKAAGGQVLGAIPEFLQRLEVGRDDLTDLIVTPSMHSRKAKMFEMSDACVVLPGGIGTLDETIEVLTWKQLRLHDKPIILLDTADYWSPFHELIDHVITHDYAHPSIKDLYQTVKTPGEVFDAIVSAPTPSDDVLTSHL